MKSIAFYNNKGGVGKTTSAINIAYELAKNSKVLIIDVDGQANCSRFFTEELKEGLDKALVNTEVSPETALCHTRYENIDIITATPKLNGITSEFDSFTDVLRHDKSKSTRKNQKNKTPFKPVLNNALRRSWKNKSATRKIQKSPIFEPIKKLLNYTKKCPQIAWYCELWAFYMD